MGCFGRAVLPRRTGPGVAAIAIAVALTLALAGCKAVELTGTVTYRERMALPADAVIRVAVEDVSSADAPSGVVASTVVTGGGRQVPIPFTIPLADPKAIDSRHAYALRARIESADGKLLFINDTRYPVITNGIFKVQVVVKRVAAE